MHQALTAALLDCIAFLELGDERVVDPDAAVQQLESIAHALQQAPAAEREELVTTIEALAEAEDDADRRSLFAATPDAMGLRDR